MAYRVTVNIDDTQVRRLRDLGVSAPAIAQPILKDILNVVQGYAVQNLSGVPFSSSTGTHVINKRTGKGAASIQPQTPYGSPYRARLFASALTERYGGNPERYNYLKILEEGRGEIKPKYTSSAIAGSPRARLAVPGGSHELVFGQQGFRGMTGRYRFVKSIPPMEGKFWMQAAVTSAQPEFKAIASAHIRALLNEN